MTDTTIAAVSTGLQPSGICIVRMSGPDAVRIADTVYRGKKKLGQVKSHTIHYGFIYEEENDLDEVLVSVMRAPHTFTGEDIVEINCHGGILVAKRVLELLFQKGAVPAEPGEFTKRAFLNGRMDLSRAEAVIDVIDAKNEFALKASVSQLKGAVSEKIRALRNSILDEVSFIEAALDDSEHYDISDYGETLREKVLPMREELQEMIRRADFGSMLKEGVRTVIAGRPNAGKSSVLNILAGYEKAIVTEVAGTTRDVLEVPVLLQNISLILMDTAGIRDTEDTVEKIGVDRAKSALRDADLVIYVADGTQGLTEEDHALLAELQDKQQILLYNKADLYDPENTGKDLPEGAIRFSAATREGLKALEDRITELYDAESLQYNDQVVITNARQKALLQDAEKALALVLQGIDDEMSEEFLTIDLMNAYASLGAIIGEEVGDDVIDRVFEKFCMGK